MFVFARIGRRAAPSVLHLGESICVQFEAGMHVLGGHVVLRRRNRTLQIVAFQDCLYGEVTDSGMLLEVSLRLELVSEYLGEIPDILAGSGLKIK